MSPDDPKFMYTHVIFRDDDDYFSAELPEFFRGPEELPIMDRSSLQNIPEEHILPLFKDKLTICPDPERADVYIKQPRLTGYDGLASLSLYMLQEARICEVLVKNEQNQNVARYLGCVVNAGRITGLCFQKYELTLRDHLREGHSVDNESYLEQIKAGIDHLHSLNLVHNDIHSGNVMFTDRDCNTMVVIDFDSCAVKGSPMPPKQAQGLEYVRIAEFENDDFSFKKLREELDLKKMEHSLIKE